MVAQVLAAVVAVPLFGVAWQRLGEARDRRRYPRPGRLVNVGDVDVHVVVRGSGPPVLIDSGLGGSSIEWAEVIADLEHDFTVISYDRPGLAWSPGSRCDRRGDAAATRITGLLAVLGIAEPAILVGHSLGGVHIRLAAALEPAAVGGLVLVDPSHEGMLDIVAASRAATLTTRVLRVLAWLAPMGMGRLAGGGLSKAVLAETRQPHDVARARISAALTLKSVHGLRAVAAEHGCLEDSLRQLLDLRRAGREPDLPLTVISAAAPSTSPRVIDARAQIDQLHADLVAASPRARHVLAERSGHLVPLDQPEIIAECVRATALAMR